jgi:hypothetical protein
MQRSISRLIPALLAGAMALSGFGQEEGLVRDFEKLGAKERARIAKEEQEAASKDIGYQAVMAEAEELFRAQRFEASMAKFKEARALRPYNVYPKVKIQDLEALIAERDAEAALSLPEKVEEPKPSVVVPVVPDPVPVKREVAPPPTSLVPAKVDPKSVVAPLPKVVSTPVVQEKQKKDVPLQEGERIYKEGRSIVVERHVELDGRIVVFRKVSHPWGAVDHFRDGGPIPAHAYEEVMEGR